MPGPAAEAPKEFSRIVTPDRLSAPRLTEVLEASPAERAAVALRLDILGVDRLTAELTVKNLGGRLFRVEGAWAATVRQACVVTLEPLAAELGGHIEASYATEGHAGGGDIAFDPEGEDPAELLPAGGIDLGELVVQELAVALDPYPRAPGAEVPAEFAPPADEEDKGPFAVLKALKGKN